jgi:hypothetical protein
LVGSLGENDRLLTELRQWQSELTPLHQLWQRLWQRYRIIPGEVDQQNTFRAQIRVPYTHFHVETIVPRLVGSDIKLRYRAVDDQRDAPIAQMHTGLANFQADLMDLRHHFKRFVRQGAITGYTVAKDGWTRERQDVSYLEQTRQRSTELGTTFNVAVQRTDEGVVIRNQPFVETVYVGDFVFPLWAPSLNHAPAVWQRSWVPLAHILQYGREGYYSNVSDVEPDGVAGIMQSRDLQYAQQQISFTSTGTDSKTDDPEMQVVELWERWSDDRLQAIASPGGKPVQLRDDPTPYHHQSKPFIDWSPVPEVFQMHGIGIVAGLYDLNEELTTLRRQRLDGVHFSVNPAMKGRGFQSSQLQMYPGRYFPVDDMQDLQPVFMPQVDWGALERCEESIKLDMQNVSGATAPLTGDQSAGGQAASTATGIATLAGESNKRIDEMRDELATRALKRLGFHLASYNAQFSDATLAANFSDDPQALQSWQEMMGLDLADEQERHGVVPIQQAMLQTHGRLAVVPDIGIDAERRLAEAAQWAQTLIQVVAPFLAMQPPPLSVKELVDLVLEKMDVPPDRRKLILDNQEELAAFVAQQQAAQQPSGPGGDNAPTGQPGGLAAAPAA